MLNFSLKAHLNIFKFLLYFSTKNHIFHEWFKMNIIAKNNRNRYSMYNNNDAKYLYIICII